MRLLRKKKQEMSKMDFEHYTIAVIGVLVLVAAVYSYWDIVIR